MKPTLLQRFPRILSAQRPEEEQALEKERQRCLYDKDCSARSWSWIAGFACVFLLLATTALAEPLQKVEDPALIAEALASQAAFVKLTKAGKFDELKNYYTDTYYFVRSNGEVIDRKTSLDLYREVWSTIEVLKYEDQEVYRMGELLMISAVFTQRGTVDGKSYGIRGRSIDLLTKENGIWKAAYGSLTKIVGDPKKKVEVPKTATGDDK